MEEHERRRICREAVDDMEESIRELDMFRDQRDEAKRDLEDLESELIRSKLNLERLQSLPIPGGGGRLGGGLGIAAEIARQRQIADLQGRIDRLDIDIRRARNRVNAAEDKFRDAARSLRRAGDLHRRLGCDDVAPRSLVRP